MIDENKRTMTHNHIPFERSFALLSKDDLSSYDHSSIFGPSKSGTKSWSDLQGYRCVIILGEGKCGKTHEFKHQHQKLINEGSFSFFIPLEQLHDSEFLDTITEEEEFQFELWSNDSDKEAVFFLDAVDELKLRRGTLRKAIRKIKEVIGPNTNRVRFFISCRPYDWEQEIDLHTVESLVPPREQSVDTAVLPNGEEIFTAVITRNHRRETREQIKDEDASKAAQVLSLLPLSHEETIEFATLYAPDHAETLKMHLQEKELWHLYQLPAEIISGLDQLVSEGRLGNLEEQLEFGIGQKLRELSNKKRNSLSENRALEGAERIALALFLMKRRSIYFEKPHGNDEGVSIADLLADWSSDEQSELLGKPIFDPTGVGDVRFYHRSTQEFLAAKRLNSLRKCGLATADLFNLLFNNIGNEQVIVPSMEPVTAWLALWNPDVLVEVKKRNPLLLFRQGIPALLTVDLRADLIRRFVQKFANSEWRRVGVGHSELKRIATQELAPVVRELWDQAYTGHDTRELLLELIELTPMSDCTDLTLTAALDLNLPDHHRTYATLAVLRAGTPEQKHAVSALILEGKFPESIIRSVIPDLLPDAMDLESFIVLVKSLTEVPDTVLGLEYSLMQAVKSDSLSNEYKVHLRDDFTQAIWENRTEDSQVNRANSKYDHFADSVLAACCATTPTTSDEIHNWVRCLAIALHFGERQNSIIAKLETKNLLQMLSKNVQFREAFFWACLDIVDVLESTRDDRYRFVLTDFDHLLRPFTEDDFGWLLNALIPTSIEKCRGVAFHALSEFVIDRKHPELAELISKLIADRDDLLKEFEQYLNPPPREPSTYELTHIERQKEQTKQEAKRLDNWKRWREEVLSDRFFLLDEENRELTLHNFYKYLRQAKNHNDPWQGWDSKFIETIFSSEFLAKIQEELSHYWRQIEVQLYSERAENSRNSYPEYSLRALLATKCSAEDPNWAKTLTHEDAVKAVRISILELNGFASFITQIETHHPDAIEEVIVGEMQVQLRNLLSIGDAPMLHDVLYHGTSFMQKIVASLIIPCLPTIETEISDMVRQRLKDSIEIILLQGDENARFQAVTLIQNQLERSGNLTTKDRNFWTQLLVKFDLEKACEYILLFTSSLSTAGTHEDALSLFAAIWGDHFKGGQPNFDELESGRRLDLLKSLVIRVYQIVQPKNDLVHEGSYSPNTRDDAQQARSYLLQCLANTNSRSTLTVLYELSARPEFTHITDRLKQMATELAAQISEPQPMKASIFRELDRNTNYLPHDNLSLFAVMNNRLDDFEHHLLNDENSTIDTIRKIEDETELRRNISFWLNQNNRKAYVVTQEAVVIAEKRTDIRLHSSNLDLYASIELKIDDTRLKWSGTQLRHALVNQLVGQYLNHERSQVGCLLICMREERHWQHPDTKKRMNLKETVDWLQGIANEIMESRPELFVSVKGIDYSKTTNE